jgi:steroid delta-isomerase-like uncharacterized protein
MSLEANKAVARRFFDEVFNQGKLDVLDEIFSPNYVNHSTPHGLPPTREGTRIFVSAFRAGFPDGHITVDDIIAEDNKVVVRWTIQGTNTGAFMGRPATGNSVTLPGIDIYTINDGVATDHWDGVNQTILLTQLGYKL